MPHVFPSFDEIHSTLTWFPLSNVAIHMGRLYTIDNDFTATVLAHARQIRSTVLMFTDTTQPRTQCQYSAVAVFPDISNGTAGNLILMQLAAMPTRIQAWFRTVNTHTRIDRALAFAMASHARLGGGSAAAVLTDDTLRTIAWL